VRPLLVLLAGLIGLAPRPLAAQADSAVWAFKIDSRILAYQATADGLLVLTTEAGLFGIDTTGRTVWQRRDVLDHAPGVAPSRAWVELLNQDHLAIVAVDSAGERNTLAVIDVRTGTPLWDSRTLPVHDVLGYLEIPQDSLLLVYGSAGTAGATTWTWLGVDAKSGALRWQNADLLPGPPVDLAPESTPDGSRRGSLLGHQPLLFDSDSTAIVMITETGPAKIDFRHGTRIWAAAIAAPDPPALVHGYPRVVAAGGVLYVPFGAFLQAFSDSDGRALWPEAREVAGQVGQLEVTEGGLLVNAVAPFWKRRARGEGALLLDPATGTPRWPKHRRTVDLETRFIRIGSRIYGATRDSLVAIDLASGQPTDLAPLKFRLGERPDLVERRDDLLLVEGAHNLALFDSAGGLRYRAQFVPPPPSTLATLAAVAVFAADVYAMVASHGGYYGPVPVVTYYNGHAFRARFAYVVADDADSAGHHGVLKVDKDTGHPVGRVRLGTSSPAFAVVEAWGFLFFERRRGELAAYRL